MTSQASSSLPQPSEVSHITSHIAQQPVTTPKPSSQALEPHVCDRPTCAVSKVWETTELLEQILTHLPTDDLLLLRPVQRAWNGLVQESPALRLHLFVHPNWQHPATDFQLLALNIPGLMIRRGKPVHLGQWIEVHMNLQAAERILEDSRDRAQPTRSLWFDRDFIQPFHHRTPASQSQVNYSDLQITQPPIVGMQAFFVEAKAASSSGAPSKSDYGEQPSCEVPIAHSKISCDAGLTLDFLAKVSKSLQARIHAGSTPTERENRTVIFKAIVSFCQSDTAPRKRSGTRTITKIE
ncbi:hypothetical protein Q7P37_000519 [Cladosporium fusiforme]